MTAPKKIHRLLVEVHHTILWLVIGGGLLASVFLVPFVILVVVMPDVTESLFGGYRPLGYYVVWGLGLVAAWYSLLGIVVLMGSDWNVTDKKDPER